MEIIAKKKVLTKFTNLCHFSAIIKIDKMKDMGRDKSFAFRRAGFAPVVVIGVVFVLGAVAVAFIFLQSSKGKSSTGLPKEPSSIFESLKSKISRPQSEPKDICLTNEEYDEVTDPKAPALSTPFDINDYSTKHWGIVPFCAELKSGSVHGAIDFELKPDSKVYASTDGVVEHTKVGKEEGSGEIIRVNGEGFDLGYSGLTNLQVKAGDTVKRGDYIANAVRIPHGEHHVHLGITINKKEECPLKYMDDEFKKAFKQMFAQADYQSQTDARCACDCESLIPNY